MHAYIHLAFFQSHRKIEHYVEFCDLVHVLSLFLYGLSSISRNLFDQPRPPLLSDRADGSNGSS